MRRFPPAFMKLLVSSPRSNAGHILESMRTLKVRGSFFKLENQLRLGGWLLPLALLLPPPPPGSALAYCPEELSARVEGPAELREENNAFNFFILRRYLAAGVAI